MTIRDTKNKKQAITHEDLLKYLTNPQGDGLLNQIRDLSERIEGLITKLADQDLEITELRSQLDKLDQSKADKSDLPDDYDSFGNSTCVDSYY